MIKLNNKNITYVALADSNNSLKAPKEIWYADSNNSVKLVYRRKDALIEGVDYEKFHWLCGRNGAYIDTNYKIVTVQDVLQGKIRYDGNIENPDGGKQYICGTAIVGIGNPYVYIYISTSNLLGCIYKLHNNIWDYTSESNEHTFILSNDGNQTTAIDNDATYIFDNQLSEQLIDNSCYLFRANRPTSSYFHGDIAYFRITDNTFNVDKVNMIPCQLLKPLPKWLDANGIRRNIGECGMIDLVSGKFYGNVNSVGTFTVENYYERKEWLVGDGSAYIVNKYNLWNNNVETRSAKINLQKTENNDLAYKDANGLNWAIQQNPTLVPQLMANFREEGAGVHILEVNHTPETFELKFYKKNGYAVCLFDGIEHQGGTMTESKWNKDISPRIYSYKMSYIREVLPNGSYRSNLIPCTLTMDLPASMDANNIARTKGTSGMWDLVSDKFYGNVANSGTFKAVNLAEGVDYEVHQWLKGDGAAYIDTNIIVNSSTLVLSIKSKASSYGGALCGSRNGADLNSDTTAIHYQGGRYRLDLLSVGNNYVWVNKDNSEDTFDIDLASNTAVVNGTSFTSSKTHTNSINTFRVFGCFGANVGYSGYINKFILNDSYNNLNLIPVKLLKSIPYKYDANGIARQAGECGMYDTVNDVFYGNVASSGTFSVSDDS